MVHIQCGGIANVENKPIQTSVAFQSVAFFCFEEESGHGRSTEKNYIFRYEYFYSMS